MNLLKIFSKKPEVKPTPVVRDYRAEQKRIKGLINEYLEKAKAQHTATPKFQTGDQVTLNSRLNWFRGNWFCLPDHREAFKHYPEGEVTNVVLETLHAEDRLEKIIDKLPNDSTETIRAVFERFLKNKEISNYFYFNVSVKFKDEDLKISYGMPEYYFMISGAEATQAIIELGRKELLLKELIKKSQAELQGIEEQLEAMENEKRKQQYQNAG